MGVTEYVLFIPEQTAVGPLMAGGGVGIMFDQRYAVVVVVYIVPFAPGAEIPIVPVESSIPCVEVDPSFVIKAECISMELLDSNNLICPEVFGLGFPQQCGMRE